MDTADTCYVDFETLEFYNTLKIVSDTCERSIVLLSGGIDSVVLAYDLRNLYPRSEFLALFIDYGQKTAKRERKCARYFAKKLDMDFTSIKVPKIPGSSLTDDSKDTIVVPNRNMIFLSIAAGIAIGLNYDNIYIATHKDDWGIFPDCRPIFYHAMNATIMVGNKNIEKPLIRTPYIYTHKYEIIRKGFELGVPFEKTWTCYEVDKGEACGRCNACIERELAFEKAGIVDPLLPKRKMRR